MFEEIVSGKPQDKFEVLKLLNEVTIDLHKKGINQWVYPCDSSEIEADLNEGNIYLMRSGGIMIGTFSLKDIDSANFPTVAESKYLYRIAVLPEYQGKKFGLKIVNYCKKLSRDFNKTLYLDCWAGNEKLRSFYSDSGFEHIGDFPEDGYLISAFKYI
jgi:GNAT superfamily N-acetyltransferase